MKLASINEQHVSEIIDIVKVLRDFKVIESLDI